MRCVKCEGVRCEVVRCEWCIVGYVCGELNLADCVFCCCFVLLRMQSIFILCILSPSHVYMLN